MWGIGALQVLLGVLGGVLAGATALGLGGLGGIWATRRAVTGLADVVGDLQATVQREVKRRAGEASQRVQVKDQVVEELVARATQGPPADDLTTGPGILRRARSMGVAR